ncbi:MAG: hypothetical protein P4L33_06170 [Capsulimonadaceae bacterium]|nr:hypothetical protein [Capsulimonadaceae bacterium]
MRDTQRLHVTGGTDVHPVEHAATSAMTLEASGWFELTCQLASPTSVPETPLAEQYVSFPLRREHPYGTKSGDPAALGKMVRKASGSLDEGIDPRTGEAFASEQERSEARRDIDQIRLALAAKAREAAASWLARLEHALPAKGSAANGAPRPSPASAAWEDVPLDNPEKVLGPSALGSGSDETRALQELSVSRAWLARFVREIAQKVIEQESPKTIDAAVDKSLRALSDELMSSRRL